MDIFLDVRRLEDLENFPNGHTLFKKQLGGNVLENSMG